MVCTPLPYDNPIEKNHKDLNQETVILAFQKNAKIDFFEFQKRCELVLSAEGGHIEL